jgi:hypothetical protein
METNFAVTTNMNMFPKCSILIMDSAFFVRRCSRTGLRTSHSTWLIFYRHFLKNIRPNNTNPTLMPKAGISDYEALTC